MFRRIAILAVAAVSLLAITAGIAAGQAGDGRAAKAVLRDATGAKVGVVRFTEHRGGVRVRVDVTGARRRVPWVPRPRRRRVHPALHLGDGAPQPGRGGPCRACRRHARPARQRRRDRRGAIRQRPSHGLADLVGRALIVHAGPDNYANIPTRYAAGGPDATTLATGDAGGRAACGVIERTRHGTTSRTVAAADSRGPPTKEPNDDAATAVAPSSTSSRVLGAAGILGGTVLLAAFVIEIPDEPQHRAARSCSSSARSPSSSPSIDVRRRPETRLSLAVTAGAVLANGWCLAMIVLARRPGAPVQRRLLAPLRRGIPRDVADGRRRSGSWRCGSASSTRLGASAARASDPCWRSLAWIGSS